MSYSGVFHSMKLPKKTITSSVSIEVTPFGEKKTTSNFAIVCRNCGEPIKLRRKSINAFTYNCSECGFTEELEI